MKVELVARTVPCVEGVSTADFAAYVARIGKVKDNPEKLMKYMIDHAHWSPFQHTYFSFKVETSRAIGRQMLRHLSFTFQELSQRYEEIAEFEPIEIRMQAEKNRQSSTDTFDPVVWSPTLGSHVPASVAIEDLLSSAKFLYEELLKENVARECARMILPECTRSTILMTGSVRSWIHFLAIRDDEHAQKEVQLVAREMREILTKEIPIIFGSLTN